MRNISLDAYISVCLGWIPICLPDVFIFAVQGEEIQSLLGNFTFVSSENADFIFQGIEGNTTIRYTRL